MAHMGLDVCFSHLVNPVRLHLFIPFLNGLTVFHVSLQKMKFMAEIVVRKKTPMRMFTSILFSLYVEEIPIGMYLF